MMRFILAMALGLAILGLEPQSAHATGLPTTTITVVSGFHVGSSTILFSTANGKRLSFDASVPGGKELMSIVLAAFLSKGKVDIDYGDCSDGVLGENNVCRLNIIHLH